MRILVCIKPVRTELVFHDEDHKDAYVINPYDLYALNECVKLKKQVDCEIICLSMGVPSAEVALKHTFALGADIAILLRDNALSGSDTIATSYALAKAIESIGNIDLIIFGEKAVDGETGQVGLMVAERLGYYCLYDVCNLIDMEEGLIKAKVKENVLLKTVGAMLPLVISFTGFTTEASGVSLMALKKALKKQVTLLSLADIEGEAKRTGMEGSKTVVINSEKNITIGEADRITGSIDDMARIIIKAVC